MTAATRLLLLPGLDGTGELYADLGAALPADLELEVKRYPLDRPMGYGDLAEWVRPRLPRAERWFLVGESFSGPLALRLARERPAGLAGLVLVATFGRRPLPIPASLVPDLAFAIRPPRFLVRHLMFEPGAPDEVVDEFRRKLSQPRSATLGARARAALGADELAGAGEITVPVLYLRAGADRLFDGGVEAALRCAIPGMRTETIPDAPHLVLQRHPEEAARILARWVRAQP